MDTQTFMNDLRRYAGHFAESAQSSNEFLNYFEANYGFYVSATPEERGKIRTFVKSPLQEKDQSKSFFGRLLQSKQDSQMAYVLLMFVKQRALPSLKSTGDKLWLLRGLVAISMDNFSGKFDDPAYIVYPMKGDCTFLLADLYVTAEEKGIDPKPIFEEIASISDDKDTSSHDSMKGFMARGGDGKLVHERRTHGKFVGMF